MLDNLFRPLSKNIFAIHTLLHNNNIGAKKFSAFLEKLLLELIMNFDDFLVLAII